MPIPRRPFLKVASTVVMSILPLKCPMVTFAQLNAVAKPAASSDQNLANTHEELLSLLRLTPTLTQVVATDPTLLADQEYVGRTNPQLAQFLAQHPEVIRNPDFYLFAKIPEQRGRHVDTLRRRGGNAPTADELRRQSLQTILMSLMFLVIVGSFLWLIRILLENRRWGRAFRMQSEMHMRLIERFARSEELLQYMTTEPGKQFLARTPVSVHLERDQRLPGGLVRVLAPLQIGIVLTLLGMGLIMLRNSLPEISAPLLLSGVVVVMPGIGLSSLRRLHGWSAHGWD